MRSLVPVWFAAFLLLGGCSAWEGLALRSQSPEEPEPATSPATLVGDLAVPYGMFPVELDSVALVSGLKGTGSDPKPGPQRSELLSIMQARGITSPNAILSSGDTSLVLVRGVIRPGIQKGDRFDLEVRTPSDSETTTLRGGYLLETELKEQAVLNNKIASGHAYGRGEGPVLVDPSADPKTNSVHCCRGRVLGGGIALKSRPLGLVLKPEFHSVFNSARIELVVNKRFHSYENGIKVGMAKAKTNEYVELKLHPRYKNNVERYIAVIRSLPLRESETERNGRLILLEKQLADPITSKEAALELEALGKLGTEVLKKGLQSKDAEVRFYSAEALAYLDQRCAAAPLGETARNRPALRVFALAALSAMSDYAAVEQLHELLKTRSAETRYGAFRALWTNNPNDPAIRGENLSGQFSYHLVDTPEAPMIHVTRSRRPEVVLFGRGQEFSTPISVEAGNRILVTSHKPGEIVVSKFVPNEPDQKRTVSLSVDEVIRAIVELGGTYPDVVQALEQAKASGALASRFEVDALPQAGRPFQRQEADGRPAKSTGSSAPAVSSPVPDLYRYPGEKQSQDESAKAEQAASHQADNSATDEQSKEKAQSTKGFFAKMFGQGDK